MLHPFQSSKNGYKKVGLRKEARLLRHALLTLLAYQHFPRSAEIPSRERVEIDSTRNRLTKLVRTIPVRGAAPSPIHARRLFAPTPMSEQLHPSQNKPPT